MSFIFSNITIAKEAQPWAPEVFAYVKERYGEQAEKRMRYLNNIVIKNRNMPVMTKLKVANDTFNQFPWIADQVHWKNSDYWATPFQMITTFGGDCEDIAIAKFAILRHLGIKREQLYLAYVKVKPSNQAHMVLLFKETPNVSLNESKVLVLDNNDMEIKVASERQDLTGVYILDPDGGIYLVQKKAKKRLVGKKLSLQKLKKFKELQKRYLEEKALLKKLNNGKYLFDYN